jgi:hypothetical protein
LSLGHGTVKQTIFELFLSVNDHLLKSLGDSVTNSFQKLCLLHAQDGHRVLAEGLDNSLVAERLILKSFAVSVLFEFRKTVRVKLV